MGKRFSYIHWSFHKCRWSVIWIWNSNLSEYHTMNTCWSTRSTLHCNPHVDYSISSSITGILLNVLFYTLIYVYSLPLNKMTAHKLKIVSEKLLYRRLEKDITYAWGFEQSFSLIMLKWYCKSVGTTQYYTNFVWASSRLFVRQADWKMFVVILHLFWFTQPPISIFLPEFLRYF